MAYHVWGCTVEEAQRRCSAFEFFESRAMYRINPFGHWMQLTDIFGNGSSGSAQGKPVMTGRAAQMAFRMAAKAAGAKVDQFQKKKAARAAKTNGVDHVA